MQKLEEENKLKISTDYPSSNDFNAKASVSKSDQAAGSVFAVQGEETSHRHFTVNLNVNGQPKVLLLDTGAAFTILKHDNKIPAVQTKVNLISVTGTPIKIMGEAVVEISSPKTSTNIQVILVDPTTPIAADGLLGADFLRQTKAILNVKNKSLTINDETVSINEGTDKEINAIIPVEYMFPDAKEYCDVILDANVTVTAQSQQIAFAKLNGANVNKNLTYVINRNKIGKTPLFVANSLDAANNDKNVIAVLLANPSPQDILLKRGMCITKACPSPNYREVEYNVEEREELTTHNVVANVVNCTRNTHITSEMIEVDADVGSYKEDLIKLLNQYRENISLPGEAPGRTNVMRHVIRLSTEKPLYTPQYRVPVIHQKPLDDVIDDMLKEGVIRESKSPYNSPIVVVPKPDGSIRPCVDFRNINRHVIPDRFPLPILGEILQSLSGNDLFSTIDCQSGFWQIELEEESKPVTAFSTRKGHFEYNVLPFGLKDAAPSFERMMTMTLSGLINNSVLVYLDDVIVFSKGPKEHLEKLQAVLERFKETGLTLKLNKCAFFRRNIKYLGHRVSSQGVELDPDKAKTIESYKPPDNRDKVRSFLGLLSYYRAFIPNFSRRAEPLTKLLRGKEPFVWSEDQQAAFDELKSCLLTPPILRFPSFDKPFFIATDASDSGLGASLLQEVDGKLMPISYASRTLNKAERNYSVTKREALAVVWALRHYKYLVLGYQIIIITDHKPLLAIFRKEPPDALMARWLVLVQEFAPHIRHIPGKTNILADSLSRYCDVDAVSKERAEDEVLADAIALTMVRDEKSKLWINAPWQDESLATEQSKDKYFAPIIDRLNGRKCGDTLKEHDDLSTYFMVGNILYKFACHFRLEVPVRYAVCCVPDVFLKQSCQAIHKNLAHAAVERSILEAKKLVFNVNLESTMKQVISSCNECLRVKGRLKQSPLFSVPVAQEPFETISMDFMGPLPRGRLLNVYVLIIVDQLTRYLIAVPTRDRSADTVINVLQDRVFSVYNVPKLIISDNAKEFTSDAMSQMAKHYGIQLKTSTPYHPQGNGIAERSVRKVIQALRIYCERKAIWDMVLPEIVAMINATYNSTVGDSPHYAVFGFDRRNALSSNTRVTMNELSNQTNEMVMDCKQVIHEAVKHNTAARILDYNKKRVLDELKIGQRVFVHKSVLPDSYDKIDSPFQGPFRVEGKVSVNSYQVKHVFDEYVRTLHRDKLLVAGEGITVDESESDEECEKVENEEVVGKKEKKIGRKRKQRRPIPTSDRVLRSHNAN